MTDPFAGLAEGGERGWLVRLGVGVGVTNQPRFTSDAGWGLAIRHQAASRSWIGLFKTPRNVAPLEESLEQDTCQSAPSAVSIPGTDFCAKCTYLGRGRICPPPFPPSHRAHFPLSGSGVCYRGLISKELYVCFKGRPRSPWFRFNARRLRADAVPLRRVRRDAERLLRPGPVVLQTMRELPPLLG